MRLRSIVPPPDQPAELGATTARRTAALLYAAACLFLIAAMAIAVTTSEVSFNSSTLTTIAAYPALLAVMIAAARPRGADRLAFDHAQLHAWTILVGSVGLALVAGLARLRWFAPIGYLLVVPVFAEIVAVLAGVATGIAVARRARRGIAYLAAMLWFPIWIIREILQQP